MTLKKKTLGLVLVAGLALAGLTACGTTEKKESTGNKDTKSVGILQLVEHESLDATYEGFREALAEEGFKEGDNLTIEYQNAQNNQDNLKSMSEKLVKAKPDLILGIATPAAQSLLNETTEIPILVTAVTDLTEAKLVASNEAPGGNLSGTSDMGPIEEQIELLLSIVPDAKTVGIMYNASEANSIIQANIAKKALEKAGIKVSEKTANSTNDVQQVTTSLAKNVDAIYIPTDNTFASAAAIVGEVAKEHKVPVIAASVGQIEEGGLATFGIDYKSLGKQTGHMAAKILRGEAKPADMPVEYSTDSTLFVNEDMAKALGIDPASITAPK